jgi:alpha-galactosidase
MYKSALLVALFSTVHAFPTVGPNLSKRLNNGVGVTPALGFNNWNAGLSTSLNFKLSQNTSKATNTRPLGSSAATALAAANYVVSLGLKDVGYTYINIDDTWSNMTRSNGLLVPDSNKWPNGIKAVADQIHGLGLKFGSISHLHISAPFPKERVEMEIKTLILMAMNRFVRRLRRRNMFWLSWFLWLRDR